MNNGWVSVSVGDVCEAIFDGPHATPKKTAKGPIFLGISNLQNGQIDLSDVEHLSEEDFIKWTRRVTPQADDIVFSYETRLGEAALVPDGLRFCLGRRMALMRPNTNKVVPRFLLYAYLGPEFQQTLRARTVHGSTVDRIPLVEFPSFPISIPPLPEQRAIAGIIGALDDKIELNRRMNRTLESMARAVFRQWFVEHEDAGSWELVELGQIADVIDCMHTKKPERVPEGKPMMQLWNILDNGLLDMTDTYYITETSYEYWTSRIEASPGDCVITNTGRVAAVAQIPEGFKAALGRNMTGIRCKKEFPYPTFLLECLRSDPMRQEIDRKTDVGTILNSLNVRSIPGLIFRMPRTGLMERFEATMRPFRAMMEKNLLQSRTLATLRDTLLPKLIRGEVRVKDVEREL